MNDCQVLNTQAKDNELFYGTAFARGVTTIKSEPGLLRSIFLPVPERIQDFSYR
jgi:hypothetical protein